MEVGSQWYNRIAAEISQYQYTLGEKGAKKYKLDLLLRVARRVDSFYYACAECQVFREDITESTKELGNLIQLPDRERRKSYFEKINNIIKHLKKSHKLVTKGQYTGIGLMIGIGVSTAIGAALDNPGIGPAIGTAVGLAIGSYLDKKAKDEGRVI